jgi:hypothetical protein
VTVRGGPGRQWTPDELVRELTKEELNRQSDEMVKLIRPYLAHSHPAVQSVVIAQLLAMWLAGHPRSTEKAVMLDHMKMVIELVPYFRELMGTESDERFKPS